MEYQVLGFDGIQPRSPLGEPWPLWVHLTEGKRLHVAVHLDNADEEDWTYGRGRTLCGYTGRRLYYPGVFSRLGMPRCAWCCRRLGIPRGIGHPKNSPELRSILGYDNPVESP